MKTMTVRDVRQKWPVAEKALRHVAEIVVTRDGQPVARILPIHAHGAPAPVPVDWDALARWRARFAKKGRRRASTAAGLAGDRAERA